MPTLLYEVDTADKPAKLKAGIAVKFRVYELTFVQLAKTIEDASRVVSPGSSSSEFTMAQRAERRKLQVKAFDASGVEVAIEDGELLKLPRSLGSKIAAGIDKVSKVPGGKVIVKGDGADTPVIFKLGSGLIVGGDKGEQTIYDIEFSAKTWGDIEIVLCAGSSVAQTLALIENCALPLAKDLGIIRFPSMMLDQITMNDGVAIMNEVLPGFLE